MTEKTKGKSPRDIKKPQPCWNDKNPKPPEKKEKVGKDTRD